MNHDRAFSSLDIVLRARRLLAGGSIRLVSFDVFDTLVFRRLSPDVVMEGVCRNVELVLEANRSLAEEELEGQDVLREPMDVGAA